MQENHLYRSFTSHRIFKTKAQSQPLSRSLARRFFLVMGLCFGFLMSSSPANASAIAKNTPSFDCGKAETEVEKLICADSDLSQLDAELNDLYKKIRRFRKFIFHMNASYDSVPQKRWLEKRNNFACTPKTEDKKQCLISLYKEGIQLLKNRQLYFDLKTACKYTFCNLQLPTSNEDNCFKCDFSLVEKRLREGADINGLIETEGCPAYFAARSNKKLDYILSKGARVTEKVNGKYCPEGSYLFAGGFSNRILKMEPSIINYTSNDDHRTLLFFPKVSSDVQKDTDRIDTLCKAGIDANIQDIYGRTALIKHVSQSLGSQRTEDNFLIIRKLKECGTDVSIKDINGHNALYYFRYGTEQGKNEDTDAYRKILKLLSD